MKRYRAIFSVLLTLALPVAGMSAETAPAKPAGHPAVPEKAAPAPSGHSAAAPPAANAAPEGFSGKVVETMEGGGYTYALLEKGGKKSWAAFTTRPTVVGEKLTFKSCMDMPNFQSKALNRTFDTILFCSDPEEKPVAVAGKPLGTKSPGAVSASAAKVKVAKASGANAYTVAEVFAKSASLNAKKIQVRGQVVKVSPKIMDRNWIHLQDGSGDEKKKNHDLVITSNELPAVGETVTITGIVAKDKDFGGGYKYGVILEKGTVKK